MFFQCAFLFFGYKCNAVDLWGVLIHVLCSSPL